MVESIRENKNRMTNTKIFNMSISMRLRQGSAALGLVYREYGISIIRLEITVLVSRMNTYCLKTVTSEFYSILFFIRAMTMGIPFKRFAKYRSGGNLS